MLASLRDWLRALLRGQVDGRFTGLAIWGRRSIVARGYDDWTGCVEVNLGEPYPADDESNRRADQMLRDELGPQYTLLMRQGYIDVPSTLFRNTAYRLRLRRPIEVFKNGRRQPWRLCVVSIERVPPADEFLMKYLWLRANEEYVLTTANRVR
jgi:hypothetical protein